MIKKKISVLLLCCLLILTGCNRKINNNTSNEKETKKYVIEKEENIEDNKELLKLICHDPDTIYYDLPEREHESIDIYYKIDFDSYKNKNIRETYNNDENLKDLVQIIKEKLNVVVDSRWKYVINEYNEESHTGMIIFLYYIGDVIGTNKAIIFEINNGVANKLNYSYLDRKIDEEAFLYRYNYFINHYKQEKKVIDEFKDYYTIHGESLSYTYYYGNNKLFYSYNIFYKYVGIGLIDNDWGTEMYIEPKIIEDILKTKKIVIRDSNTHEITNSIIAGGTIREIAELLSRTLPMGKSEELKDTTNSNWKIELYDENEELIDTLFVWEDVKLGYNNSRDEYLKDNYKEKLIKIITEAN